MDERSITLRTEAGDPAGEALEVALGEAGHGGRPLLLLHGFTGAKEDLTPWLDRLAALGFHAVAPDLRGHGASAKPTDEAAYSLERFAGDALALADALGWGSFALLGHSMGGMVAQEVVLADPSRVDALVLMDTHHGPVEGVDPALRDLAVTICRTEGIDHLADLLDQIDSPGGTEADARLRAADPEYAAFGARKLRASSPAMYAAMAHELLDHPDRLDPLHAAVHVPTLVIVGDQDKGFLGSSRRLAAAITGARLVVVEDAGHSPQFEAPDAWWAALSGFLSA